MGLEVRMEENTEIVRSDLGRIMTRVPRAEEEFTEELMEIAVDEISRSAEERFNEFTGNMQQQISRENIKNTQTFEGTKLSLSLTGDTPRDSDYLEWHERADQGHYVSVDNDNRPIMEWVQREYDGNTDPNYLFVTPTPFVKPAVQRIARKARRKAESEDNAIAALANEV